MAAKATGKKPMVAGREGRVSMLDVAAQAGVSRSAVSLALRGHPSIPAPTRSRILAVVRRVGYRTNPLVAALMSARRTGATGPATRMPLAFLTCHVPPDSWRQAGPLRRFHAAAKTRAAELGFSLDEFSLGKPELRPERLTAMLRARGIHGILVAPLPGEQTRLDFDFADFAAVGLGMSVREPAIDRVSDDHFHSAHLAFAHCRRLGYRRIGLALAADTSRRLENRWWSGFLAAQQALPPRARIPALMPETREEIPPRLNAWIRRHAIDAVIFTLRQEELMACAPPTVGLVSLAVQDDRGQIAGIRQNERQVGQEALEMLVAKLHQWNKGAPPSPRLVLIPGRWCDGCSAPGPGQERRSLLPA